MDFGRQRPIWTAAGQDAARACRMAACRRSQLIIRALSRADVSKKKYLSIYCILFHKQRQARKRCALGKSCALQRPDAFFYTHARDMRPPAHILLCCHIIVFLHTRPGHAAKRAAKAELFCVQPACSACAGVCAAGGLVFICMRPLPLRKGPCNAIRAIPTRFPTPIRRCRRAPIGRLHRQRGNPPRRRTIRPPRRARCPA